MSNYDAYKCNYRVLSSAKSCIYDMIRIRYTDLRSIFFIVSERIYERNCFTLAQVILYNICLAITASLPGVACGLPVYFITQVKIE